MARQIILYMNKWEDGALRWLVHQRVVYDAFVGKLKPGDTVEIAFKKQGRKKTNRQLGYWFSILVPHTIDALREAGYNNLFEVTVPCFADTATDKCIGGPRVGIATDKDTVDILLKTLYKMHTSADKLPLKRNMTTAEMSALIDHSLKWVAENLNVFIPTPKE